MPTSDHTRAAGVRQAHDVSRDDVGEARNRGFEQRLERWRTARFRARQLRQNYASKFLMLQCFTSYIKGWRMAHHNVIMITAYGDVGMAVKAMKAGAFDFLEKPVRQDELLSGIERALLSLSDRPQPLDEERKTAATKIESLTGRQREILDLVLAGNPSKNIAADLQISQRTVDNHRAAIMRKVGAKSLSSLIRIAVDAS